MKDILWQVAVDDLGKAAPEGGVDSCRLSYKDFQWVKQLWRSKICCSILFVSGSDCKDCYSLQSCRAGAYKVTVLCINLDNRLLWTVTLVLGENTMHLDEGNALMFSFLLLLNLWSALNFHILWGLGMMEGMRQAVIFFDIDCHTSKMGGGKNFYPGKGKK